MKPLVPIFLGGCGAFYLMLSQILELDGFTSALTSSVDDAVKPANHTEPKAAVLDCRPVPATGPAICVS